MKSRWVILAAMGMLGWQGSYAGATVAVIPGDTESAAPLGIDTSYGWEFTTNEDILVTHLGLWLHPWYQTQGFFGAHPVAIWNKGNPSSPLVSDTIPAGTIVGLLNSYLYVDSTDVTLTAGTTYVIATYWTADSSDRVINWIGSYTAAPEITVQGGPIGELGRFKKATGFQMPTDLSFSYFPGPNFQFGPAAPTIPAPGAAVLCAIGAAVAGWLRRRRTL